jgi:drug/metabolite transporter (DMT)-like permease
VTFLKEKLSREVWLGLLLTIIGGGVIAVASSAGTSGTENALMGNALALAGAIAGSIYITIGRSVRAKVSLFPYIWMVFSCGALVAIIFVLLTGTPITGHPPRSYFWLIMVTLIPQLIGHSGFNYALGYFSATLVSLTTQTLSITAAIAAFFIFAEVPTLTDIIGSSIIIGGVILAIISQQRKQKSTA